MSALTVEYERGGVYLPHLGLWLDPHQRKEGAVFVSHAHSDHTARHSEVILSLPTAAVMRLRLGGKRVEHVLFFGETREFKLGDVPFQLTLLPAGHILGSAMALVEADGERLLYTGDFKLRPGLTAEPCELRPADVLVMETTFGRPNHVFPPDNTVWPQIEQFCSEAIDDNVTPVLLVYSLGKCQEVLKGLEGCGFQFALHEQAYRITRLYEELGVAFPAHEKLTAASAGRKVVLWPPGAARSNVLKGLGPVRKAIISGWALDRSCKYRFGVDAAFPISDHADYPDLLKAVRQVSPSKVWTLHGSAAEFAARVRDEGYDALALSEPNQLTLPLKA